VPYEGWCGFASSNAKLGMITAVAAEERPYDERERFSRRRDVAAFRDQCQAVAPGWEVLCLERPRHRPHPPESPPEYPGTHIQHQIQGTVRVQPRTAGRLGLFSHDPKGCAKAEVLRRFTGLDPHLHILKGHAAGIPHADTEHIV
jgi:hypothetical protein